MAIIYHVTTGKDWDKAKAEGSYVHPSLKEEGFIHCSLDHQVSGVLDRYFRGEAGLVKLVIDTDKLKRPFVFDWSPSTADSFPHIYGPINMEAVSEVIPL
jgi:uncharacterized protein (DUF952 family)